ncbi:LppU/SCO3897 family protein [Saccharothrix coeruleofusca]|nr:hypothetical protein [Saccharothrix coeruleofusca]
MRKIGWGVGAAAVVVAGACALAVAGQDGPRPRPGECAAVAGTGDEPRYRPADCGSEQANVRIAKVLEEGEGCPKGGARYSTYAGPFTLCLIPNFVEGACYRGDRQVGMRRVDCAGAHAVRVAKVGTGEVSCGSDRAVAYPEPSVTFCLARGPAAR